MNTIQRIINYFRLESEVEDFSTIHNIIEKDVVFKGTNLWILMFAIFIASVGLNMNSTAVIIGAMLISPLMGPINGIGYSIATYNFPLLRKALKNFGFAVGASLVASTTYFIISPVSTAHSELLARTSPTIYDVIIALFGGLAGIVAMSSRQKGNVIPGVAIATALMPPLCTAGYGLATAQLQFFFGAFYLFTINMVFIALASLVVSRLLKFPITDMVDKARKKNVNRVISVVITITLIPSIYFGYNLVQQEKFTEQSARFIRSIISFEGRYLIDYETKAPNREISLVFGGNILSAADKLQLEKRLSDFSLENTRLRIEQGFDTEGEERTEKERVRAEVNRLTAMLNFERQVNDSIRLRMETGKTLLAELKTIFPEISGCAFAETSGFSIEGAQPVDLALVSISSTSAISKADKEKISNWISQRTGADSVKVMFEERK